MNAVDPVPDFGVMMRRYVFIARVLALLIGFYVMCAALIAGLVTLTALAFRAKVTTSAATTLLFVTLAASFVVIRGVFVSTRVKARDIVGIEVYPAGQQALWLHVRHLASMVGTAAPSRLHLVAGANASVWENSRLLGLIPGRREMAVGVALLMALTPAQLDAVLAHELGHYGNRDTRLGGLVSRARQSVLSAIRAAATRKGGIQLPGAGLFIELFQWYAKLVLRVTQEESRAQEYAADRVAARIAGPANVIAALERLPGIDAAFDFYLARYVSPGIELGLLPPPPDLFGGFIGFLAEPSRQAELARLRDRPARQSPDPYDSHPPLAERIAALPHAGYPPQDSGPRAVGILADPGNVLAAVAMRALREQLTGKQATTWDALAQAVGLRRADTQAKPLQDVVARLAGRPPDLAAFTGLVAAGRLGEVLDALPMGEAAQRANATGRLAREHAKTELAPMLTGWLAGHLARTGQAAWAHSWADAGGDLRMAPALKAELDVAVASIVAVWPDGTPLRALVMGTAVPA
jgi:Zn-dependent protease with chaperone function